MYKKFFIVNNLFEEKFKFRLENFFEVILMKKDEDEIEDSTKYGEFVSSYFAWLTLEGQKEKADELNNITKKKSKK